MPNTYDNIDISGLEQSDIEIQTTELTNVVERVQREQSNAF